MTISPERAIPRRKQKRVVVKSKTPHEIEAYGQKTTNLPGAKHEKKRARRERGLEVLNLRKTGATFQEIADALHINSASQARKIYENALKRVEMEAAKEVIALDLLRLDEYQMRATHALRQNGDLGQIDRLLRIMEFRYRLLGVNEETVRSLQADHGIHVSVGKGGSAMVINASPETSKEFIAKMMSAVGIDPDSKQAQEYVDRQLRTGDNTALPMLEGSANDSKVVAGSAKVLDEEAIIDAEIVEEL